VITGSTIATYNVTSLAECLFYCAEKEGCKSCNYEHTIVRNSEGKLGLCELNNRTIRSCPFRKVGKKGYSHFQEIQGQGNEVCVFKVELS
jgi:hypothetical protein